MENAVGKAGIVALLLLIGFFSLLALSFAVQTRSFANPTGAFSLSFATADCHGTDCPGDDSGNDGGGNNGGNGSNNGGVTPSCPRADDPGTIVCVEAYNNKIQCCDEATEVCSCGPGKNSCVGGKCMAKSVCPNSGSRPDQTEKCVKTEYNGLTDSQLLAQEQNGKDPYCCYNSETESCQDGTCSLCPIVTERPEAEGKPPLVIKEKYCEAPSAQDKEKKDLVKGADYCCYDPRVQQCYKGSCIRLSCNDTTVAGRNATERTCFQKDKETGRISNAWCCPLEGTREGTVEQALLFCGDERMKAVFRTTSVCDSTFNSSMAVNGRTYTGCREVVATTKPKDIICPQNSGQYNINQLCSKGSGCPVCQDGRKPRLFVIWGKILDTATFGGMVFRQCGIMDDEEHCVFTAGVKNESEYQALVKKYAGCFSDISLFAHGCPAGLEEAKQQDQGENTCKFLNPKNPGTVTALSCGLLSTAASDNKIPIFVQSCCKVAPKGTIINGSTTPIQVGPTEQVETNEIIIKAPFCAASEVCYECDGKGGAVLKSDCGGLIPDTVVVNNAQTGYYEKRGKKWVWVAHEIIATICKK